MGPNTISFHSSVPISHINLSDSNEPIYNTPEATWQEPINCLSSIATLHAQKTLLKQTLQQLPTASKRALGEAKNLLHFPPLLLRFSSPNFSAYFINMETAGITCYARGAFLPGVSSQQYSTTRVSPSFSSKV